PLPDALPSYATALPAKKPDAERLGRFLRGNFCGFDLSSNVVQDFEHGLPVGCKKKPASPETGAGGCDVRADYSDAPVSTRGDVGQKIDATAERACWEINEASSG